MKIIRKEFSVSTRSRTEMIDITGQVDSIVRESGIRDGEVVVFCPHTTAAKRRPLRAPRHAPDARRPAAPLTAGLSPLRRQFGRTLQELDRRVQRADPRSQRLSGPGDLAGNLLLRIRRSPQPYCAKRRKMARWWDRLGGRPVDHAASPRFICYKGNTLLKSKSNK